MKTSIARLLPIALMAFAASSSHAAEKKTLRAVADVWQPYISKENPSGGLSSEIVKAAFATQGYDMNLEFVAWVRALSDLKSGSYDLIPDAWMSEERKKDYLFSDPYLVNEVKFLTRKGETFAFDGLKSLTGKRVGIIRGYAYSDEFTKATDFQKEEVVDFVQNVRKLVDNRIDLTLEDEITAIDSIKKSDEALLKKVEFSKSAFAKNDLYVITGKAHPKGKEIIDSFNKGLAEIKANGTYQKIMAKYKTP